MREKDERVGVQRHETVQEEGGGRVACVFGWEQHVEYSVVEQGVAMRSVQSLSVDGFDYECG